TRAGVTGYSAVAMLSGRAPKVCRACPTRSSAGSAGVGEGPTAAPITIMLAKATETETERRRGMAGSVSGRWGCPPLAHGPAPPEVSAPPAGGKPGLPASRADVKPGLTPRKRRVRRSPFGAELGLSRRATYQLDVRGVRDAQQTRYAQSEIFRVRLVSRFRSSQDSQRALSELRNRKGH